MSKNPAPSTSVTLVFTQILQVISILGLITIVAFRLPQAGKSSNDYVADPTKAYSLDTVRAEGRSPHVGDWLGASAWSWVALGLLITLVLVTLWRLVLLSLHDHQIEGTSSVPLVVAGLVTAASLITAGFLTSDSTEYTFATWAQQRYGIELQSYPTSRGFFFDEGPTIDTHTVITLDDGQTVRMEEITDARGDTAYLIAPAQGSAKELEVIAK